MGFFGHYDVEAEASEWSVNPWQLNGKTGAGLVGVATMPLTQRILLIEDLAHCNLVFILQEGEIKVYAMEMYPTLIYH